MGTDAPSGTHPLTRCGSANAKDNNIALGNSNSLPELVTTFRKPGTTDVGLSSLQI